MPRQFKVQKVFYVFRRVGDDIEKIGEFRSLEAAVQAVPENSPQYWVEQDFVRVP